MSTVKRLEVVKRLKLCFNCLGSRNHVAMKCQKQGQCHVSGCSMKHSSLLHDALITSPRHENTANEDGNDTNGNGSQLTSAHCCFCGPAGGSKFSLPVVAVTVKGLGMQTVVCTAALLDPSSNKSFCSMELVRKLVDW